MVALRRAAHQILDQPVVLDDPIALRIVGSRGVERIRSEPRRFDSSFGRALRLFLVARSRCAEDALAAAIAQGVRQYVVLGAGLDTFAYRNPYPADQLRVFEVDMPATQAWKRDLLARTKIGEPATLTFVPVDFERQSLPEQLRVAGFREGTDPRSSLWLRRDHVPEPRRHSGNTTPVANCAPGSGMHSTTMPPGRLPWLRRIGFCHLAPRGDAGRAVDVVRAGRPCA
jgi:methyltransferase (TIGR00027 family)